MVMAHYKIWKKISLAYFLNIKVGINQWYWCIQYYAGNKLLNYS